MTQSTLPSDTEIRDQAYYLWEAEGRPFGRDAEYWQRASALLSERAQAEAPAEALPPPTAPLPKLKMPPVKAKLRGKHKLKLLPKRKSEASKPGKKAAKKKKA